MASCNVIGANKSLGSSLDLFNKISYIPKSLLASRSSFINSLILIKLSMGNLMAHMVFHNSPPF